MSLANRVITDSKKNVQKQDLRLLLRLAPLLSPTRKLP